MDSDKTGFEDSANDIGGVDDTLRPMEALDADDVRNDDGDEVVDPPDHWTEADRSDVPESLDEKLAAENPEAFDGDTGDSRDEAGDTVLADDEVDHLLPDDHGIDKGQISGTPEDGGAIFPVVE
jgi:hypothetical protein